MNFGDALKALKDGKRVRRDGWSHDAWLTLQMPDEHGNRIVSTNSVPWSPSQMDLLSEDWMASEIEPLPR